MANLIKNSLWFLVFQILSNMILLVVHILLTKELNSDKLGLIGIVMIIVAFCNCIVDGGLGGAVVRVKEITTSLCSTVFYTNLAVSVFLNLVLWIGAPFIAVFFQNSDLTPLIQVASFVLIINAFTIIPISVLTHQQNFKVLSLARFYAVMVTSVLILGIEYVFHISEWSLVFLQMILALVNLLFLLFKVDLKYLLFNWRKDHFKYIYSFGTPMTFSSLSTILFQNSLALTLGKFFSMSELGFMYQAQRLTEVFSNLLSSYFHSVFYSNFSKIKDEVKDFIHLYVSVYNLVFTIIGVIVLFFILYSTQFINIVFGEKWKESSFYLTLLMMSSFWFLQDMYIRLLFKIFNQGKLMVKHEIFKRSLLILNIVLAIYYKDIKLLMWGNLIIGTISYIIQYFLLHTGFNELITKISKSTFLLTIILFVCWILFNFVPIFKYIYVTPLIVVIYIVSIFSMKLVSVNQLMEVFKKNKI